MNKKDAISFIRHNRIFEDKQFASIVKAFEGIYSKSCSRIEYGFSLSELSSEVGFELHPFYKFNLPVWLLGVLKERSFFFVFRFLAELNDYKKAKFNLEAITKILKVSSSSSLLFIHFGLEIKEGAIVRFKLHFIPLHNLFPALMTNFYTKKLIEQLNSFVSILGYNLDKQKNFFTDDLNAFAIDFSQQGGIHLKLYRSITFRPAEKGMLLNFDNKVIDWLLARREVRDADLMYRMSKKNGILRGHKKVYFYHKPPIKIKDINGNDVIQRRFKNLCSNYHLNSASFGIYAVSLEEKNIVSLYIR